MLKRHDSIQEWPFIHNLYVCWNRIYLDVRHFLIYKVHSWGTQLSET